MILWNLNSVSNANVGIVVGWELIIVGTTRTSRVGLVKGIGTEFHLYKSKLMIVQDMRKLLKLLWRNVETKGGKKMGGYVISQDKQSGMYYVHMKGYAYIPVFGSFCEKKSDAREYQKMMNGLPNKVEQIEKRRHEAFVKEYGLE